MLIHSVMPIDALLPEAERPKTVTVPMGTGFAEGILSDGKLTVTRLESTNPSDYLDPAKAPGSVILLSAEQLENIL